MAYGIEIFRDYFSDFKKQYTIIGGMACDLLMNDAGLDFRRTMDIDMVLIVEAITNEFVTAFWKFIEDGGYEAWKRQDESPVYYRFVNPKISNYPYMIELFASPEINITLGYKGHLIPIHFDDNISSLSAILLNEDYYKFLLEGITTVEDISVLDVLHIIPLKMRAWIDLLKKKEAGNHVNNRDIMKHRQDVFRLFSLVNSDARVIAFGQVHEDIKHFITEMRGKDLNLRAIDIKFDKDFILDTYERIYNTSS